MSAEQCVSTMIYCTVKSTLVSLLLLAGKNLVSTTDFTF